MLFLGLELVAVAVGAWIATLNFSERSPCCRSNGNESQAKVPVRKHQNSKKTKKVKKQKKVRSKIEPIRQTLGTVVKRSRRRRGQVGKCRRRLPLRCRKASLPAGEVEGAALHAARVSGIAGACLFLLWDACRMQRYAWGPGSVQISSRRCELYDSLEESFCRQKMIPVPQLGRHFQPTRNSITLVHSDWLGNSRSFWDRRCVSVVGHVLKRRASPKQETRRPCSKIPSPGFFPLGPGWRNCRESMVCTGTSP